MAQHLRPAVGEIRKHTIGPYMGNYLSREIQIKPAKLADFRSRLTKLSLTDDIEQVLVATIVASRWCLSDIFTHFSMLPRAPRQDGSSGRSSVLKCDL